MCCDVLDLSAAFDTVSTLVHYCPCSAIGSELRIQFLTSARHTLANRCTYDVKGEQSDPHGTDCSVSQDSVLGPLKFVSYTEDSVDLITTNRLGYHLYADDTRLIGCAKISDMSSTIERLQQCVNAVGDWCASRRLQLNLSKTEYGSLHTSVWGRSQPMTCHYKLAMTSSPRCHVDNAATRQQSRQCLLPSHPSPETDSTASRTREITATLISVFCWAD